MSTKKAKTEETVVTKFREYLRCKTVHPDPDYDDAVKLLISLGEDAGLSCEAFKLDDGDPVVIMKLEGSDPSLQSLLLNSHMDVVPAFLEHWDWDPFAADKDEEGNIYARGTQDMKCVSIQYIEALKRLKASGFNPLRNIYLSFVPDEEIGGSGMKGLLALERWKQMNPGFALDEGLANPEDKYTIFYGERGIVWLEIKITGDTGHGSRFIENTCAEKMQKIINSALSFREAQKKRMEDDDLKLGDVTSLNLTFIEGGLASAFNVLPTEMRVVFDIRLSENFTKKDLSEVVSGWCQQAGNGVSFTYLQAHDPSITKLSKRISFWTAFEDVLAKETIDYDLDVFPAATDSRFLRTAGIPCVGFSPMKNIPILLHDHNEFINEDVFMEGIKVYEKLIPALANVPKVPVWEDLK